LIPGLNYGVNAEKERLGLLAEGELLLRVKFGKRREIGCFWTDSTMKTDESMMLKKVNLL